MFFYAIEIEMIRIICGTILTAVLVNLCCCTTQEAPEDLISNSSFEDESGGFWSFSERTSRWSVERRPLSTSSENVRYSRRNSRTGHSSLSIEPWTKKADRALFISQYGTLHAGSSRNDAPLVLELWSLGKDSKNLKINFDISYRDNRFMFVEANPIENENDSSVFVRTCIFIPNYGSVKSFMFHLIVDSTIHDSIYIDNVSLRFASSGRLYSDCLLYVDSFPVQRSVLNDFLKPPSNGAGNSKITLAVQLAKDQLDMLEQTAAVWKGPISAALLLFGEPGGEQLSQIVERYYESQTLSSYATLHIVWEDRVNGEDVIMYPANALANIAIAFSTTDYVFFLDADVHPASSESEIWKELSKSIERAKLLTQSSERCERCAFVSPLFDRTSKKVPGYPKTKDELKQRVEDPASDIQVCLLPSHASVDYHRWFTAEGTYEIEYGEDSELYFIVPSTAPLMNDLYAGYGGRDRRAYGRDLHAGGFRFFVLDEVFVVDLSDPPRSGNGTARRLEDVPTRVFLNIDFHVNDLEHGYLRYPASYSAKFIPKTNQLGIIHAEHTHTAKDENNDHLKDEHKNIERSSDISEIRESAKGKEDNRKNTPLPEINDKISENDSEGGLGCKDALNDLTFSLIPDMNSGKYIPAGRMDMMLESLMQTYGTFTYIEIPSATVASRFRFPLQLMQPEAAIAILPQQEIEQHRVNGIFENYRLRATAADALKIVAAQHPGRKLFSLNAEELSEERAIGFSNALLRHASDGDVILIELRDAIESDSFWSALLADMCAVRPRSDWKIYRKHGFAVMKSRFLRKPSPEQLPEVPRCHADFRPRSGFTTDVILFSKNRPLQTFAFMDSLKRFVTGLSKVWLLVKTEGAIFDSGYDLVADCFSTFVQVEIVNESKKPGSFGQQLLDVIRSSSADSIMIAVDEIIWLRPVDLSVVSSMLHDCGEAATFQLRLGDNLRILATSKYPGRFAPFKFNSDYLAFYPRRLPYDFGYVLNVDGVVSRRQDLIADFEGFLGRCGTPGCVEQGWIVHRLHDRSRQWHLMYRQSRLVNNMGMVDGRVADRRESPAEGSYELARILVEERRRIDVERFAAHNRNHFATHQKLPVDFIPIEC